MNHIGFIQRQASRRYKYKHSCNAAHKLLADNLRPGGTVEYGKMSGKKMSEAFV